MAWNGDNNGFNPEVLNYMHKDTVFLLDVINPTNCAYLIGDLTRWVFDPTNSEKVLSIMINSPGGEVDTMRSILSLINIAKINGMEVYTFVLGLAGSAASLIALQGDKRYMSLLARHFVHFGCIFNYTMKHTELEKIYTQNKAYSEEMVDMYIQACAGKLSRERILALQEDECGYLSARECLESGLCDIIIEDDLAKKKQIERDREEYDAGFSEYMEKKNKQEAKDTKKKQRGK